MELSIVVPVFNVQDYVKECILSLLEIPIKNFEIIVVDDGSLDESMNVVNNIKSEKIRIIRQKNRGLSSARNTGLKNAIGEYILFIDSDDYIENASSIKIMLEIAKRKMCDVVVGNGEYFWSDEKKYDIYSEKNYKINFFENGKSFFKVALEKNFYKDMVWLNLYNREFLIKNKLFFLEGVYHEDAEWMPKVLINSRNIYFLGNKFYIYRQRTGSIINSKNIKKNVDLIKISQLICNKIKYINDKKLEDLVKKRYMEIFYMALMSGRDLDVNFFEKVNKNLLNERCNNLKTNIKFFIAQCNIEFAYKTVRLRRVIKRKLNV